MASSQHLSLWKRIEWYVIQVFGARINLVLCGRRKEAKTLLAESILGRAEVRAASSPGQCVKHQGEVCGRWVSLVELPALSGEPLETVMQQCLRCISLCGPEGVHAFILVLPLGPLTDEDKDELEILQDTLSSRVKDFTVVLNFSKKSSKNLAEQCQNYGGGCIIFNPMEQPVSKVIDYLYTFKTTNETHSYTTETMVEAQIEKISQLKKLQESTSYNPRSPDCRRIAVIGKTGSGKSASGNTILGRREFETKPSQRSITKECKMAEADVDGRQVFVVDTPGLFDTTMSGDEVSDQILRCVSLLAPGPHVFLLVLQIGRFTPEENITLKLIKERFGKNVEKYTIILFTHGDKLVNDQISIEKYKEQYCDDYVKELISNCGNKYHVFNNCNREDTQVRELMEMIDERVTENEGGSYTIEMLLEAEMNMRKEMRRKLEEKERKIKEQEDEIKYMEEELKEKEETVQNLQQENKELKSQIRSMKRRGQM